MPFILIWLVYFCGHNKIVLCVCVPAHTVDIISFFSRKYLSAFNKAVFAFFFVFAILDCASSETMQWARPISLGHTHKFRAPLV